MLAYPLDHALVLEKLAAAGIGTVWSFPYAHREGVAAGLNAASARTVQEQSGGPVEVIGGATVHPRDEAPAAIVKEAFEEHGLRVLKLHCSVGNFSPDDPALNSVWELVSLRRVPVVIHLGHAVSGHTNAAELVPLVNLIERYPEARIIVAHCGHSAAAKTLDLVQHYPHLYADLTPVVFDLVDLPPERAALLSNKLLFGTDAPNAVIPAEKCLEHLRSLHLPSLAESAILGGTARRLIAEVLL